MGMDPDSLSTAQHPYLYLMQVLEALPHCQICAVSTLEGADPWWLPEILGSNTCTAECEETYSFSAGSGAQNTELSFRLKRTDIEKVHVAGDDQYYDAGDEVIRLCDLLHDERWDQDSVAHAAELMQS